jgi:glycosyltransferase involved in cell wall biosynthesis
MYSGNIGLYYDLENLMGVIERFKPGTTAADGREVAFAFVGGGTVLDRLVKYKEEHRMENVVFIPYQDKDDLNYSLNAGDVQWVVNSKGIKGVSCPSKFYGCASGAKPILGVLEKGTEVRMLIEESFCGLVCEPGEYDRVEENIQWFIQNAGSRIVVEMGRNGRKYLLEHLTKDLSVQKYEDAIKAL